MTVNPSEGRDTLRDQDNSCSDLGPVRDFLAEYGGFPKSLQAAGGHLAGLRVQPHCYAMRSQTRLATPARVDVSSRSDSPPTQTLMRMAKHRIYTVSLASVYPHYLTKAERKGRSKAEVDEVICWLTGYSQTQLDAELGSRSDLETFFANAPRPNPSRHLIKGVVCGVRVEDIEEPTMKEIRYLDKLVDELARGKAMEKVLRR